MSDNFTDGNIFVDYSSMQNAADDMVSQTRAIAITLSNLEAELSELQKTWYGKDGDVYREKQAAWNAEVKAMERSLNTNASVLNDIHGNYKYSENSLSDMWSQVGGR